jgi:hypothetical protein
MPKTHFTYPDNTTYCGQDKVEGDLYVRNTHDAAATAVASRTDTCGVCFCVWLSIEAENFPPVTFQNR